MSKEADEWIDPRPKFPNSGAVVFVKRENGKIETMTFERTWTGGHWKSFPNGMQDSIASPAVVGWKYC
jgi:hypothetical protein